MCAHLSCFFPFLCASLLTFPHVLSSPFHIVFPLSPSPKTIDHDDGSQYYNDTGNLMVFGGCKNYMGHSKSCDHNVIVHPGISERSAGGRRCQTDDNKVFANQYHHDNHCFVQDGGFYSMGIGSCNATSIDPHVYVVLMTHPLLFWWFTREH